MAGFTLDERTRLTIELALTAGEDDTGLLARQETHARQLGLTGAEIDAARRGWSFDVQTSAAVALAIAPNEQQRVAQRERALRAGLSAEACREIERFTRRFTVASASKVDDPDLHRK